MRELVKGIAKVDSISSLLAPLELVTYAPFSSKIVDEKIARKINECYAYYLRDSYRVTPLFSYQSSPKKKDNYFEISALKVVDNYLRSYPVNAPRYYPSKYFREKERYEQTKIYNSLFSCSGENIISSIVDSVINYNDKGYAISAKGISVVLEKSFSYINFVFSSNEQMLQMVGIYPVFWGRSKFYKYYGEVRK